VPSGPRGACSVRAAPRAADKGLIRFHAWIGDGCVILFSHPEDFTPVCTTELGYLAGLKSEFEARNCKVIGLSVDPVEDHRAWEKDIAETQGHAVQVATPVNWQMRRRAQGDPAASRVL